MKRNLPSVGTVVVRAGIAACVLGSSAGAEIIYGVTSTQRLVSFDSANPGVILSNVAIGGAQGGETIRGIDFRPLTGGLFALGSSDRLYEVNVMTGAMTMVGPGPFTPAQTGTHYGFDFNPTIDRIRVVGDDRQNSVLNPLNGAGTAATAVFYAAGDPNQNATPVIVGSAYDRNFNGGVTSQLYSIDTSLNILTRQANSAGTLNSVGALGFDFGMDVGFDVSPLGTAFATDASALLGQTRLYTINLMTGAATPAGIVGGGLVLTAMSATPSPAGLALLGAAGLVAGRRRR